MVEVTLTAKQAEAPKPRRPGGPPVTIAQALKAAKRIYVYFGLSNGGHVALHVTKAQVREIAQGGLKGVFTHIDDDVDFEPSARWSFNDGTLHLHFLT